MVSWDGWRVRTLLHKWSNSYTTPHQTPDILIGPSQSRSTAGSRSQAQARVMSEKNGKEAPVWGGVTQFGEMSYPGS